MSGAPDLTETCYHCKGHGRILVRPSNFSAEFVARTVLSDEYRICERCNGAGRIRLRESLYDGSPTHQKMQEELERLRHSESIMELAARKYQRENMDISDHNLRLRRDLKACIKLLAASNIEPERYREIAESCGMEGL